MSASAISIVMPAHNRAQLVERALASIAAQSLPPLEVILVDDASTDDTVAVAKAWAATAPFAMTVIEMERNGGAGAARNRGMQVAAGEFIAFLDSDDEYLPHALEALVAPLRDHPEACVSFADARVEFDDGAPSHVHVARHIGPDEGTSPIAGSAGLYRLDKPRAELLLTSYIPTCSAMFRRADAEAVGWMPETRMGQDWLFWLKLTARGDFLCRFEPVSIVHRQSDNLTGAANYFRRARLIIQSLKLIESGRIVELDADDRARVAQALNEQTAAFRYFASREGLATYWQAIGSDEGRATGGRVRHLLADPKSLVRAIARSFRR